MTSKLRKLLAALMIFTTTAWAVNPPGSTCSGGGGPCGEESGNGTAGTNHPYTESLKWGIKVGLARYPKPTSLSDFGQAAFELNGNLPSFGEIYGRYFSSSPLQQRQIHLELFQPQISATTFHPSVLFHQSEATFTTLKKPAAGGFPEYIHQILTDDAFTLIEILPTPESGWRLRNWKRNAAPLTLSGGFYITTGFNTVPPLTDVTFRRPTSSTANDTLIYIQKENTGVSGTRTLTNEIIQTLDANGKPATVTTKIYVGEGTAGDLLSQENLTYSERGTKVWDYTITREVLTSSVSASGTIGPLTLTSKTRENYDDFSTTTIGGQLGMKRLVSMTHAFGLPGQSPQTTSHTYIQAPTKPTIHGRLESTVKPDGSWTFNEYAVTPTSPVAITKEYSSWKDLTIAQRDNARKTVTEISANETLTETTLAGILISKTKTTLGTISGDPITTSEAWDGAAWHITTTAYFPETAAAPSTGRIKWIETSDGTATTYSYATVSGKLVTTQRSGAGSRTGITAGTEVKTTYNLGNFAIGEITKDIASNLSIQQWDTDLTYNGGFDQLGRPIKRIYNADVNDYDISQYACCGLEFSRDRSGATTSYSRDGHKRVYKVETKVSAASPAIATFTAVNGLTSTQTRTVGSSAVQFLGTSTRSLDGLTITTTSPAQNSNNPADRVTTTQTITRSATGDTLVTTNDFDAATSTTTTFLSGQMKSSTRTGYATTIYDYTALGETTTSGTLISSQTSDLLGRTLTSTSPDKGATGHTYYDNSSSRGSRGKPATLTDADGLTITYGYNSEGEQTTTSRPIPLPGGTTATQVTTTENDVVPNITLHGTALGISLRSTQKISSAGIAPITTATSYRAINGLVSGSASFGLQSLSIATRPSATTGIATQTSIAPDGTKILQTTTHGLLTSSSTLSTSNSALLTSTSTYNSLQQLETSTDSRTGTTTYSDFTESGQALTTTTPAGEITTTTLDRHGRPTAVKLPNNTFTYTSYHLSGQPAGTWGSLTNPTFTIYDDQGRRSELRTYQTLTGEPTATSPGFAKTTWQYSPTTGHLITKRDHENKGATYTYTAAGRLNTRTWARSSVAAPKVTTYNYTHGHMTGTDYSDTTPDITIEYDALGRQKTVSTAVAKSDFAYNPVTLLLDTETISYNLDATAGYEFTRVLDRSQDSLLRDSGWTLGTPTPSSAIENSVSYAFGATDGRLASVNKGSDSFSYLYAPSSSLIATVTSPAHIVSNVYEPTRNVLASKVNKKLDTTAVSSYFYTVNNLGQRTNLTTSYNLGAGVTGNSGDVAWGYDSLGQVTSAGHSADTAFNRAYAFDMIGNRLKTADSLTLPVANNYTPNALNQYSQITNNSITNNPAFDADGNMTSGPLPANVNANANSTLVWDGENRLIQAQVNGGATVNFTYDAQSRRIAETIGTTTKITIYDGWNPIAGYSTTYALTKTYIWGVDLSGSMQGAGGVGGLLAVTDSTGTYFPTFDGNGNVSEYLDSTGAIAAHYEYDPFGKTTVATGPKANDFAHRFSTKPLDLTTGLYYYGYRFYDPYSGRWPSRDPIGEAGGINLYGFVGNDGVNTWDVLGEKWKKNGKTKDERRLIWIREDETNDTMEDLANKVGLDPDEADNWARQSEDNKCEYTTPNVWIMIKLLNGINSFRDIYTNPGDEIGDSFTFTGSSKKVDVTVLGSVTSTIENYSGDIIGLSLFAHGSPGYIYSTSGDWITQNSVLSAVDKNGFKLKKAYLMQCHSGADGYDNAWNQRVVGGNAITYQGLNVCGLDFGNQPKKKRKLGPPHRR